LASKVTTWPLQPPNHGSPSPSIFETVPWIELAIQIGSVVEVLPVVPGPVVPGPVVVAPPVPDTVPPESVASVVVGVVVGPLVEGMAITVSRRIRVDPRWKPA